MSSIVRNYCDISNVEINWIHLVSFTPFWHTIVRNRYWGCIWMGKKNKDGSEKEWYHDERKERQEKWIYVHLLKVYSDDQDELLHHPPSHLSHNLEKNTFWRKLKWVPILLCITCSSKLFLLLNVRTFNCPSILNVKRSYKSYVHPLFHFASPFESSLLHWYLHPWKKPR